MNSHQPSLRGALFVLILNIFLLSSLHAEQVMRDEYPFSSAAQAERFHTLSQQIRCVVCQNQTIADSYAPLAKDLRNKIYQMILLKKSNADIQDYLVKRYGEFILFEPRMNKFTFLLWTFPLFACGIFLYLLRAMRIK
jgi:cytochrome c-type biogenesis protein CcmH